METLENTTQELLNKLTLKPREREIANKVFNNERINEDDALFLFQEASTNFLGILADYVRRQKNKDYVFFNRNIHIEPTNYCIYNCKYCSYARKLRDKDGWVYSVEDIEKIVSRYKDSKITEVHITGGVHPHYDVYYYAKLIKKIKEILPNVHIKAFTAIEIEFMSRKAKMTPEEGLKLLKEYGLNSMPGGGAEILVDEIQRQLHDKPGPKVWLEIHRTAHRLGIPSNATMLYGHLENHSHRVEHLRKLRDLQDETHGFNAFIPLKYRSKNNRLSYLGEVSVIEDMRTYAVSRIYLDNFPHIKAYWVNIGKKNAQMALSFGVDDLDGTIDDTTKIYTMAGSEEQHPRMTATEMIQLIKAAGLTPVERDSVYNIVEIIS